MKSRASAVGFLALAVVLSWAAAAQTVPPGTDLTGVTTRAPNGATITLGVGEYPGQIVVDNKSLTVRGDPGGGTVLAEGKAQMPVRVGTGGRLILEHVTFKTRSKDGFAVLVRGGSASVSDCWVRATIQPGMYVDGGSLNVSRCRFEDTGDHAIEGFNKASITVRDSTFSNIRRFGVAIQDGTVLEVVGSTFTSLAGAVVAVKGSTAVTVRKNTISKVPAGKGAIISQTDGKVVIADNTIIDAGYGISLKGRLPAPAEISGNTVVNVKSHALDAEVQAPGSGEAMRVTDNRFISEGGFGVLLDKASKVTLSDNLILVKGGRGVIVQHGASARLAGNIVSGAREALYFHPSAGAGSTLGDDVLIGGVRPADGARRSPEGDKIDWRVSGSGAQQRLRQLADAVLAVAARTTDYGGLAKVGSAHAALDAEAKRLRIRAAKVSRPSGPALPMSPLSALAGRGAPAASPSPPPTPAPARSQKHEVGRLLREGNNFLAAKKLTTPKARSALDRYRQVLALDPQNIEARKGITKILKTYTTWAKKPAKNKEMAPPAAKPAPETETAGLLRQGKELLAAKKLTTPKGRAAIDRFRQVLAIDSGNAEAKKGIAQIAATYRSWGDKALKNKEPVKAERYLMRSAEIEGGNAATYAFLGYARLDQNKYKGALAAFRKALEISPGTADYYTGIGMTEFQKKDYHAAIKAFEQVVAKRPNYADTHRLIGIANEWLGNWRAAVDAYGKAYRIKPKPDTDDLALGRLHVRLKEYGKAVPYLQRAAKHAPNDPVVFDHLATVYHFLERVPEAIAAVKTRNRLEREGAKGAGKGKKEGKKVAAFPPASKPGVSKPPLSGVAEARANFDAGRHATAYYQYKAEAEKGNAEAAYMLGRMRHQGLKVRKNLERAFGWYMQAARAGHAGGQAGIGYMYYRGVGGVRRDHSRAAYWFEKAAKGGISGAMSRLGQMYERGEGVRYSSRKAAMWYMLAARKGNRAARKRLRELGSRGDGPEFSTPLEIDSGLGELPPLTLSGAGPAAAPAPLPAPKISTTAKPPPALPVPALPKPSRGCGGMIGGLGGC